MHWQKIEVGSELPKVKRLLDVDFAEKTFKAATFEAEGEKVRIRREGYEIVFERSYTPKRDVWILHAKKELEGEPVVIENGYEREMDAVRMQTLLKDDGFTVTLKKEGVPLPGGTDDIPF